jgi:hypothetical protein
VAGDEEGVVLFEGGCGESDVWEVIFGFFGLRGEESLNRLCTNDLQDGSIAEHDATCLDRSSRRKKQLVPLVRDQLLRALGDAARAREEEADRIDADCRCGVFLSEEESG